jgi:hypothetical protein
MKVRKPLPTSPYDFYYFEFWLSDMANKGLILSRITTYWCVFRKGEPKDMEYMLSYMGKSITDKQKEECSGNGWDYVCSYDRIHIFSAIRGNETQRYRPEDHASTLKKAKNKILWTLLLMVALIVISIVFLVKATGYISKTPWINLVEMQFSIFWMVIPGILGVIQYLRDLTAIRNVQRNSPIMGNIKYGSANDMKETKLFMRMISALGIIISLSYIFLTIFAFAKSIPKDSPLTLSTNLDIIRLNDIEDMDKPVIDNNNYSFTNRVDRMNMLLNTSYTAEEAFVPVAEQWDDKEDYRPFLRSKWYKTNLKFLAKGVANDLVYESKNKDGWPDYLTAKVTKVEYEGLDEAYYIYVDNVDYIYNVVARKGNRVIKLRYNGKEPYTKVLEAAVKKL